MNRTRTIVAISVAAGALMACAPQGAEWTPIQAPKTIQTEVVTESYVVKLSRNSKSLPLGERQELAGFLERLGDLDKVEFSVRRTRRGLNLNALVPVESQLVALGANPRKVYRLAEIGVDYEGHWADVEVIAKRYVAIPPNCGDWSKANIGDYTNQNSSNFGCANAAALAMSVADPKDLARGRDTGDANGIHAAAGVDRYEKDRVKELLVNSTRNQSE